ncbi:peptide chain release factor 1 [Candidatus Azambacteria bacterium RIFCSPHIGHO2_01_FULL_40_24]|uniref:Peptide chain release factor 1 n=1 Tax=Candidatus Azambacteria bacterium RIFCSPHIGHO2_01_FULL_40_24 TaxID=1797301 RepID=A0A1F5B2Y8_9BACT|nr:MAG: peptide chain release factor 1 [Candidatus Azambacteria bacterium RIFCSPHIGHO2_01_FULL_40_24]
MSETQKIILEIRAGAGGNEAGLFAFELWRMYRRFCERLNFKIEIIDSSGNQVEGIKNLTAQIIGSEVYDLLKYEAGVHRVQRIPKTEKSGRIHTSTVSVAVLKTVSEVEVKIEPKDLRIDTFRSSGAGGQNVNKVETAIRITHLPTGFVVACQSQRSQSQNREVAMNILRAKLAEMQKEKITGETSAERRAQIGMAERAEKMRTYNFPQDRITDHRIGKSWHNMEKILDGNMEPMIKVLAKEQKKTK